jgi:hypothetical protein
MSNCPGPDGNPRTFALSKLRPRRPLRKSTFEKVPLWLIKPFYLWIEECRRKGTTGARQIEKTWAGEGRG